MKHFVNKTVFFIGWMLSPFTFWNDVFVNIPIAYIMASLLSRIINTKFVVLVLVSYWLSNAAGLIMMYSSAKPVIREGKSVVKELFGLFITVAIYSIILAAITLSIAGCACIPIPSSIPIPNNIPILGWFL